MKSIAHRDVVRRLHGPGPSDVSNDVLKALSLPTIGHLDKEFITIMNDVQDMLRQVFQTKNRLTIPISGTGSSGMETLVANFVEPGENVVVVKNGVFGKRIAQTVEIFGGNVTEIELDWGKTVAVEEINEALNTKKHAACFLVHAETSTGALQKQMKKIGKIIHDNNALFLVDCVTSLGGTDVKIDEWGIDAAYSGTQKCLSVPPGLSPITCSTNAVEKLKNRTSNIQSWYFDLKAIINYWNDENQKRSYHHTAPINSIYALHEGLRLVLEEGLQKRFDRHQKNARLLQQALENLGFTYIVQNQENRLPMLHAVYLPKGYDEGELRRRLLQEHNIEVGGGLGKFSGEAWRIGVMGESSKEDKIVHLIESIKKVMKE